MLFPAIKLLTTDSGNRGPDDAVYSFLVAGGEIHIDPIFPTIRNILALSLEPGCHIILLAHVIDGVGSEFTVS